MKGQYEGMYNGHSYLIEQDRIATGLPIDGAVQARLEREEQASAWDWVRGHDGHIVHCTHGMLMVNQLGEYAADCGTHLVKVTDHEVRQARAKHELREFIV